MKQKEKDFWNKVGFSRKLLRVFRHKAEIAVVCGSGLSGLANITPIAKVSYKFVGFDYADIPGHERYFEFGKLPSGKNIVVCSRFHYYEDGSTNDIYNLYKIFKYIGVKIVIATTAVGAINKELNVGDIVLIKDHINFASSNPLIGHLPINFVDMSNAYDKEVRSIFKKVATRKKIKLLEGVHVQTMGPCYETPAEIDFFRKVGGDTVSMSTVHDCICANNFGLKFVALASITNSAAGGNGAVLNHEDVIRHSEESAKKIKILIDGVLEKL